MQVGLVSLAPRARFGSHGTPGQQPPLVPPSADVASDSAPAAPKGKFRRMVAKYGLIGTLAFFTIKGTISLALLLGAGTLLKNGCSGKPTQPDSVTQEASEKHPAK